MRAEYDTLDVFTDRVFGGNPLAVFPDASAIPEAFLQAIARELNLSETVFVYPPLEGGTRRVRIFTPGAEVPFAGHPTIGTAFFLVDSGAVAAPDGASSIDVTLEEAVGPVAVEVSLDAGVPSFARLTAGAPYEEWPLDAPASAVADMLGLAPSDIGIGVGLPGPARTTPLHPAFGSVGLPFVIVPVVSTEVARRAALNTDVRQRVLGAAPPATFIYVVAPGEHDGVELHTRMFAPEIGVPEDPATGSACAALGGYLARRLEGSLDRGSWRIEQGVEMGRPSLLELDVVTERDRPSRIRVGGRSVRVATAEMEIPT